VCGLVFGTWKRGSAPRSWRASVGFVQPWDGEPSALVAWLRAEASGGDGGGGGGGGGGMIRPLAWLRTTAACGAALTRDVQAAYGDGGGDDDLADAPPPASRVFVSVDVVATAVRGKSGGGRRRRGVRFENERSVRVRARRRGRVRRRWVTADDRIARVVLVRLRDGKP
jgi:hypothetical protein